MKRILELCLSPDLGGLELYMRNFSRHCGAFAVINKKSKLKFEFEKLGLEHFCIGRYDFLKLAKIIDESGIDVIHIHWSKDIPVAVLARLFSKRKPKIAQTRHMHMTRFKDDFYHKFLYKNITLILCVSDLVKEQIENFIPKSIRPSLLTLYPGVKKSRILTQDERVLLRSNLGLKDEFLACVVGRIEESKGQHILLKAVENLRQMGINAKALVVGGCMDENYLKELKNNYTEDIFINFVDNPTDFMQICDCVVLTTKKETLGLVLLEAMRSECCVLASDEGGPLEIIDDMKDGVLFKSFDYVDLSEKLLMIFNDKALKTKLAKNAKIKVDEKFDEQRHFDELIGILRGLN